MRHMVARRAVRGSRYDLSRCIYKQFDLRTTIHGKDHRYQWGKHCIAHVRVASRVRSIIFWGREMTEQRGWIDTGGGQFFERRARYFSRFYSGSFVLFCVCPLLLTTRDRTKSAQDENHTSPGRPSSKRTFPPVSNSSISSETARLHAPPTTRLNTPNCFVSERMPRNEIAQRHDG